MTDTIPFNKPAKGTSRASMIGHYADLFDAIQGKLAQEVQKVSNAYVFGEPSAVVSGQTKLFIYNRALGALYPYVQDHCSVWNWTEIMMTEAFDTYAKTMKIAGATRGATYEEADIAWNTHLTAARNEELMRRTSDNDNLSAHLKTSFNEPSDTVYDDAVVREAYLAACDKLHELTERLVREPERLALSTLFENPGLPTEEELDAMGIYDSPPPGHDYH